MNTKNSQYSSFWVDTSSTTVDEMLGNVVDANDVKRNDLVKLASHRRAIANFVNIVTGQNIPVKFNVRGDSYTDGKTVTISSKLNDQEFDPVVGLALHEGSHILLSDFALLRNIVSGISIPDELFLLGHDKGFARNEVISHVKSIVNYVEDRRIGISFQHHLDIKVIITQCIINIFTAHL